MKYLWQEHPVTQKDKNPASESFIRYFLGIAEVNFFGLSQATRKSVY